MMSEFSIKVLTAPLGKTYFFTTGQAGFILKSKTGQLLGLDLYLSDCVERIEPTIKKSIGKSKKNSGNQVKSRFPQLLR